MGQQQGESACGDACVGQLQRLQPLTGARQEKLLDRSHEAEQIEWGYAKIASRHGLGHLMEVLAVPQGSLSHTFHKMASRGCLRAT